MFFWHLTFSIIFFIYKIESGKILSNFDEIFGQGCDINASEEIVIRIEQNDQNEQNDNSTAAIDQIGGEMGMDPNDQQKREITRKFEAIKEKLREKRKFENKNHSKIERKIGKLLGTNRKLIYKWKKELNLNKMKIKKQFHDQKKKEFIDKFDEFKELYGQGKQKEFAKELGITKKTFIKWKKELVPEYYKTQTKYSNEDKAKKMKQYFKIKEKHPKIVDKIIAEKLGLKYNTMRKWKKQFAPKHLLDMC